MDFLKSRYNVLYENGISSSYLLLESIYPDKVKNYQIEMITRNKIENILPLDIRFNDQSVSLYYNITSKLQLSQFLKRRKINKEELINILWSIGKTLMDSKTFLLSENGFVINEDLIFIDPLNLKISLVYLPVHIQKEILKDFKEFILRLILNIADLKESENDNYLHRILISVKSETFNIKDFINMLEDIKSSADTFYTEDESVQEPNQKSDNEVNEHNVIQLSENIDKNSDRIVKNQKDNKRDVRTGIFTGIVVLQIALILFIYMKNYIVIPNEYDVFTTYFGITLIIGAVNFFLFRLLFKNALNNTSIAADFAAEDSKILEHSVGENLESNFNNDLDNDNDKDKLNHNDTILLSPNEKRPFLQGTNKNNNEIIYISKDDFIIGRLREFVDHVLDSTAVGKIHAQIICLENQYFIKDLNSINGTYINNARIESNKEYKILNGDKISLANKDYIFVCP